MASGSRRREPPPSSVQRNEYDYSNLPSTSTQPPRLLRQFSPSNQPPRGTLQVLPANQSHNETFQVLPYNQCQNRHTPIDVPRNTSPYPFGTSNFYRNWESSMDPTQQSYQTYISLPQNRNCEHKKNISIHCKICGRTYCISCLVINPCCSHDKVLLHDAIVKSKKENEILKKGFDELFFDVIYRIQRASYSRQPCQKPVIQNTWMPLSFDMYCGRLNQMLSKLISIASILEESLQWSNPWAMVIAQNEAIRELHVLEDFKYTPYFCTTDIGINLISPGHEDRYMSIQSNSINLYNYNRPIFGVPQAVVFKKPKLSDISIIGGTGTEKGKFYRPWGVCCNAEGKIIVTDRSNDRIQIFNPDGSFLMEFGESGHQLGQLRRPAGVTVNRDGNIVIADKDNHRIQIFSICGVWIRAFGKYGTQAGEFYYPWSVSSNAKGEILVGDSKNKRIQLIQENGVVLRIFPHRYTLNRRDKIFDTPRDLCFSPTGKIFVTDFEKHSLLTFENTLDGLLSSFGGEGEGIGQFQRPQGIVCDDVGNVIIADGKNNRIIMIDASGASKCVVRGNDALALLRPSGICLTPDGRLVVVDFGHDRIIVYG